jgi:hypothetical protein
VNFNGTYPLSPHLIRGYKPSFPKAQYCTPPGKQLIPSNQPLELGYWELLTPALLGTAGALFLSLFSDYDPVITCNGETLFKLSLVFYAIGASVAASFAIRNGFVKSKAPHDRLLNSIAGVLVSIILFFAAAYLLLYRFFPSSFKGDVGNNFCTQFFSFLYVSITTIATANLGDILPNNLTARALIAIEIAFSLFTISTAIQLFLVQVN